MHDIRLGFRNLVQRPAFSAIAILTLALGIGANAAVFTVSNAVLLAPLPYEDPSSVVVLTEHTPQFPSISVTRYNYEDWRDRSKSFTGMAAVRPTNMTLTGSATGADPERVAVKMITATLLPILGVSVDQGRNFGEADDRAGAEGVALVSAGFAARRFSTVEAVGQTLQLDNKPHTIVGILPARFELFQPADVFVPFWPWAATLPEDRGWHPGILPIARLQPGVSLEQARGEMETIAQQLEAQYPDSNKNVRRADHASVGSRRPERPARAAHVDRRRSAGPADRVCQRRQPAAGTRHRSAEGNRRPGRTRRQPLRIVRQLLVESVVLACVGALLGLLVAAWGVWFLTSAGATGLPRAQNIGIEWRVAPVLARSGRADRRPVRARPGTPGDADGYP